MVQTCRLAASGEEGKVKVLLFPKDHSMFHKCPKTGNAPVMNLVGCPLMVKKVTPYEDLSGFGQTDNQWATWLMIEPHDGLAPMMWQQDVGPVLVYRPGGLDLGNDDIVNINTYLFGILDEYSDGLGRNPKEWVNQEYFQRVLRYEKNNSMYKDMNILL